MHFIVQSNSDSITLQQNTKNTAQVRDETNVKATFFRIAIHVQLEKQSETADLRQRHVVRQMAHHIRFGSGFPYAPLKAMLTKISKWSRIQDSFRITPKIESLVVFTIPDIRQKFQKNSSITFWVILLTHRQTNKVWQKHNLLGEGKYLICVYETARLG